MAREDRKGAEYMNLSYKVPTLTWLRLRYYARTYGYSMPDACNKALNSGLDAIGIPRNTTKLLAEEEEKDA